MRDKIRLKDISEVTGISIGHLSDMLSGKTEVGKNSAKKLQVITNRPWPEFMTMDGAALRSVLEKAINGE